VEKLLKTIRCLSNVSLVVTALVLIATSRALALPAPSSSPAPPLDFAALGVALMGGIAYLRRRDRE
jgi:MYXO-CTERM domain-containing protein